MDKTFSPAEVEPRWRSRWAELNLGAASVDSDRPAFVMALPPPNITDVLHLGHTVCFSVPDTLARYHRMLGDEVEWCPGTDHAAIATQNVIEKQLAAEGTTKEELGREAFEERVDRWYATTGNRIFEQMRHLGFSCDWSRARFTLDQAYVRAIRTVFGRLYQDGLIYRGPRIVNWCPRCGSAISDEEVQWQEHTDTLVSVRYPLDGGGEIVVATVRPETMLGDSAVAVSPSDSRHAALVGRQAVLPLVGRHLPVIADDAVHPEFGTGALKVTPGHDPTDYEIGTRHHLPIHTVIGFDGRMTVPELPEFDRLTVLEARAAVIEALRHLGAVVGEEEYVHEVGHCDRCKSVLEPLVSEQWWVRMRELADPAIEVVERGAVRFHPDRPHTDVYLTWMRTIRDWCISRQLWLGHSIPVSTCAKGHVWAWIDRPERCPQCGNSTLAHDPDVLDTWFSSALWPFAIFGWPEPTTEMRRFYPGHVMVTGKDIIFLWVARMIMTGLRFPGGVPFTDVIINSTILAPDGSRMQKSKGNGIDPLDMIERYGADAVRAWAGAVGTAGQGMRFDESRLASYRLFANKLWNVTRFLVSRLGADRDRIPPQGPPDPAALFPEDRWILSRVATTATACEQAIVGFRFHDAMERLYDTIWHDFCDQYVEMVKARLRDDAPAQSRAAGAATAVAVLDTLLLLLHPFMPFVTEECAQRLPDPAATLQQRDWPRPPAWWRAAEDPGVEGVAHALAMVGALRIVRQEAGVPAANRERHQVTIDDAGSGLGRDDLRRIIESLLPVTVVDHPPPAGALRAVAGPLAAALHAGAPAVDRARLMRQRDELSSNVGALRAKLDNPGFTAKAPAPVVAEARRQLSDKERQLAQLTRILEEEDPA